MRGILTNASGYEWLFILEASFMISARSYSAAPHDIGDDTIVHEDQANLIAGILASCVGCQLPASGMSFGVLTLLDPTWLCRYWRG